MGRELAGGNEVGRDGSDEGDFVVRKESEVATMEHLGRKVAHDRFRLDMEVAKHFIRAPAAKEADAVGVHIGAKECHCASSPKGPG